MEPAKITLLAHSLSLQRASVIPLTTRKQQGRVINNPALFHLGVLHTQNHLREGEVDEKASSV